jgi:hypothetical protein
VRHNLGKHGFVNIFQLFGYKDGQIKLLGLDFELTSAAGPNIESSTGKNSRPLINDTICTPNRARKKYLQKEK